MTLQEKQQEFTDVLGMFDTWQEKFGYIIERGNELPEMPEHLKNNTTIISGCHSRIYFFPSVVNGVISIQGWSNAGIPSGLIAILKDIFEGCTPEEIKTTKIDFHQQSALYNNLTANRQLVLIKMINKLILL